MKTNKGQMEHKEGELFTSSAYQQAIKMVLLGVEGQKAEVTTTEGVRYKAITKCVEGVMDSFNITSIYKNDKYVGRIVYNHTTDDEVEQVVVGGDDQ